MACMLLYYIEQIMVADYIFKTIAKIIIFIMIPLIYIKLIKKTKVSKAINLRRLNIKDLKLGILLGSVSLIIVISAYFVLNSFIDMNSIIRDLQTKNITPSNFIVIGLYITFGNSFLEEIFFRGFIFLNLYELNLKKTAYIYSSVLFAVYHIGIFITWFNIWLILLALIGLILIGLVFNWLDTKSSNFINSWIVHILADVGVILVGLKIFEII